MTGRPCDGRNGNVCVAEGCWAEQCATPRNPFDDVRRALRAMAELFERGGETLGLLVETMFDIAFRGYARRSGEYVCPDDHEKLRGACLTCRAEL